jgi:peptidoglycan hydrolase-like protein with peptidoglycan-binding domain
VVGTGATKEKEWVQKTMQGEDVRQAQEALNTMGFANGIDGIFGPFTDKLVRAFQAARKLKVDGTVGPATRRMRGLSAST